MSISKIIILAAKAGAVYLKIDKYKKALKINPASEEALLSYACYLYEIKNDIDGAKYNLKKIIKIQPAHSETNLTLSELELLSGNNKEALVALDKIQYDSYTTARADILQHYIFFNGQIVRIFDDSLFRDRFTPLLSSSNDINYLKNIGLKLKEAQLENDEQEIRLIRTEISKKISDDEKQFLLGSLSKENYIKYLKIKRRNYYKPRLAKLKDNYKFNSEEMSLIELALIENSSYKVYHTQLNSVNKIYSRKELQKLRKELDYDFIRKLHKGLTPQSFEQYWKDKVQVLLTDKINDISIKGKNKESTSAKVKVHLVNLFYYKLMELSELPYNESSRSKELEFLQKIVTESQYKNIQIQIQSDEIFADGII